MGEIFQHEVLPHWNGNKICDTEAALSGSGKLMHSQKFAQVEARRLRDIVAPSGKVLEPASIDRSAPGSPKTR